MKFPQKNQQKTSTTWWDIPEKWEKKKKEPRKKNIF
jgi:hypothetical protein